MEEKQQYNTGHLLGMDLTDEEVCDTLGLDRSYVGSPQLNDAAAEVIHGRNVKEYMMMGVNREDAVRYADKHRSDALKLSRNLVKWRKKRKA